ncbi:small ribosomal subunit protein mS23-like [Ornithodoros turicata]|uniref:small ribosomal subunit protein mS23-like n=1 Tax=Ornithodoros turicata TaxID=34597 RepID=UPI003139200C
MAGSRTHKLGTILTRVQGLMKAEALKYEDRPLWYDVYEAFPPIDEPNYYRVPQNSTPIRNIFYSEDVIRARFVKEFGQGGVIDLGNPQSVSNCERFVQKYQHIKKHSSQMTEDELFKAAEDALSAEGFRLRHAIRPMQGQNESPSKQAPLSEEYADMQKDTATNQ